MTKKMTQRQKDEIIMNEMKQRSPDTCILEDLDNTIEYLRKQVNNLRDVKAIPAQVEVFAAMERAFTELRNLELKYYPDYVDGGSPPDLDDQQAA